MGYHGGDLVSLFQRSTTRPPTRRALRNIAGAAGDAMTRRAAAHTPKRTGRVASKWETLRVERAPGGYSSGTRNPDYRARWLEHGVEPHDLDPKRREALGTPEGPRASAHHPGFGGAHMLAKAMAEVEASLPLIAQPHLTAWAEEIAARAKRHRGVT